MFFFSYDYSFSWLCLDRSRLVYDPFKNNVEILESKSTQGANTSPIIINSVGNVALHNGLNAANVLGAHSHLTGNSNADAILGLRLQNTAGSLLGNSYANKITVWYLWLYFINSICCLNIYFIW